MKMRSVMFAAIAVFLWAMPASSQTTSSSRHLASPFSIRIDGYIRESGYEFGQVHANSWYMNVPSKKLNKIRIIIGTSPSSLAVGAVVIPKKDLRISADSMSKMMRLSYQVNYVRFCIDPDGDLLVLAQLKESWADLAEFNATVQTVAAAAERAYAEMGLIIQTP